MANTYTTIDGDVLDAIIARYYGSATSDQLSLVMDANREIGSATGVLAAGTVITLPTLPATTSKEEVSLWD